MDPFSAFGLSEGDEQQVAFFASRMLVANAACSCISVGLRETVGIRYPPICRFGYNFFAVFVANKSRPLASTPPRKKTRWPFLSRSGGTQMKKIISAARNSVLGKPGSVPIDSATRSLSSRRESNPPSRG